MAAEAAADAVKPDGVEGQGEEVASTSSDLFLPPVTAGGGG